MRKMSGKKTLNSCLKLFLLILFTAKSLNVYCADSTGIIKRNNIFYIEFSGKNNYQSINYQHIFHKGNKFNYSYSAGFGISGSTYYVPLSINAFTTGKQHHLEFSVEVTPYFQKEIFQNKAQEKHTDKQLYITPGIGYRYQKTSGGLYLKAGIGSSIFIDPPRYNVCAFTTKLLSPCAQFAFGIVL